MHRSRHAMLVLALVLGVAVVGAPSSASAAVEASGPLLRILPTRAFGPVAVAPSGQAVYTWTPEQRALRVRCTGPCAVVWPPVLVPRGRAVPVRIAGIRGRFGTIRRPDGRRQLTRDRVPLYTYAHERPRQVLCDDVDGWFVVRARR
jgi:predicted lipoprotein with Yx(FWY)xxD motif